ncbi:MAG: hypothetical protein E7634_07835 [Ruminococcaceae bacterium]|nr:hypothetical protein [Oscillospiraceae bacterium]
MPEDARRKKQRKEGLYLLKRILIILLIMIPAIIFTGCSESDDIENAPEGDVGSSENVGNGGAGNFGGAENEEQEEAPKDDPEETPDEEPEEKPDPRIEAYILKIDGKEVAYLSDESRLEELKELFEEEKEAELSEKYAEIIKVTVENELTVSDTFCLPEEIKSAEEAAEKYYADGGRITFSYTVNEKETKYISFETVYQNSSSYYEGTSKVKTEGVKGETLQTYRVTYKDDTEVSRELVNEKTVKSPVNKVVLIGTKKSTASTGKYAWPTKSVYVTSYYGPRMLRGKYDYHIGIDLRAAKGTSIYAADGGKVTHAAYLGSYGYLIKIQHDNGDETYYAHLSKMSVKVGDRVYKGQEIAKSGTTGNVTGPHLHFEIRKNGKTVNPINYLPKV